MVHAPGTRSETGVEGVSAASARASLDRTLAALADPTRRGVIDLLRREPERAGVLARKLAASRPAMSRHLRVLRQAGLVTEAAASDDGRGRIYALEPAPFLALRDWVTTVEAFWSDQLASFRAHLARKANPS